MRADLTKTAEIMAEAIAQARHSDESVDDIVAGAISGLEKDIPETQFREGAAHWLAMAAKEVPELGDHPSVPMLAAAIGIGYALLANGEDAEVFYSMMAR